MGFSVRFGGLLIEGGTEPPSSSQPDGCRFCTTVPPGSRLVGLVGEAPSARLDEAESTWIIAGIMRADNGPAC
jgi:hypothetical protein